MLLQAARELQRDTGAHGQMLSESTDARANPNNYAGGYRYVAKGPFTDWAEKARLDAVDAYRKSAGDEANFNGMFWPVEKLVDN